MGECLIKSFNLFVDVLVPEVNDVLSNDISSCGRNLAVILYDLIEGESLVLEELLQLLLCLAVLSCELGYVLLF